MHKIGMKVLLGWVLFLPITAYSLGLGDIDVKSFLNQPLRADISIISARPGEIDDLLVGLADREAFLRASLSRPSHLSALKFKVIKSDDGATAHISVKTQTAVKEPVLNFLVEADWAKGKVFREFTILLDPPYFAQQASKPIPKEKASSAPAKLAPVAKAVIQENVEQPEAIVNQSPEPVATSPLNDGYVNESAIEDDYNFDISTKEPASTPVAEKAPSITETSAAKGSITVTDGATLWSIAKTLKTDDVSMSQVMMALQRLNQDSFGKNNINNLKQGSVLRVPTLQDMTDTSQRDAYVDVLSQNGLWNDYLVSVGHASANASNTQTDNSSNNNAEEKDANNDSLSIVTAGDGESDKAALRSNDVEQISNLRKQLLLSEEETESVKVERDELSTRVKMLEAELEKRNELQNIVNIQDDNLATMEQELASSNDVVMPAEPEQSISQDMNDNTAEITDDATNDNSSMESVKNEIDTEVTMVDESTETMMTDTGATEMVDPAAVVAEPIIQSPAPIIVSESNSSSIVDDVIQAIISNPLVQGAIAVVLLLVLLGVKFFKGRTAKGTDESSDSIEDLLTEDPIDTQSGIIIPNVDDEDETPINIPKMEENQPVDDFAATIAGVNSVDEDDEDEFSKTAIISADDMASLETDSVDLNQTDEEETEEQDETLDEVDVYLAYSLFENAEDLLKDKISDNPDRADYRAKLLDTYFATQNAESFSDEARSLKDLGSQADKYWPKIQTMGYELDPKNPMFAEGEGGDLSDLAIAKPEMADFDIGADEDSSDASTFDLSLDGDDTNFDLSEDDESKELDDADLEFNLSDEVSSESNDELPDDLGGLDFDLDDSIIEPEVESTDEPVIDIDEGLEFDLGDLGIESDNDDVLDISLDDVEPELDVSDESLGEETETIETVDETLDSEDDLIIGDIDDDMVLISSDEDDIDISLDESDIQIEEIDFDETAVIPSIESVDETAIMPSMADDTSIMLSTDELEEKTDIISAVDLDDELEIEIPDVEIDIMDDMDDITDIGNIEGLMLPDDVDEVATKLDLAKAFQDMGDSEGARSSLEEVLQDGNDEQKSEAKALLEKL